VRADSAPRADSSGLHVTDPEAAIAAVELGAAVVRKHFGADIGRTAKGPTDFATDADIEAEDAMRSFLQRERPQDAIVGEERGHSGSESAARRWLIDPLCGTLNYAVRMRVAGVNAALRIGGGSGAAAVADPFNGEVFWTDGRSAHVRADGQDRALAPDAKSTLVDLNFDPAFPNAPAFRTATLAADAEFTARFRVRVVSTSLALAWVATGQRAAYISDGSFVDNVHFAAGIALCEAAGCSVTDLRGGTWNRAGAGLVAAADARTHATLLALLAKYFR
jgi:myo-inositol-1(or 4)-monophosphatase